MGRLLWPLKGTAPRAAAELGLHELAVEDALGPHQRPKLDRYTTHLFLSSHAVRVDVDGGRLDETEIDAFVSKRWLVTVRKADRFPIEPVRALGPLPDPAAHGVGFCSTGCSMWWWTATSTPSKFSYYYEEVSDADVR